jgi:hypothetical protein
MATVNTINDLPALGRTPTSGDKLALQPQGDNTKSIDYDALATAIINKLGGDPVTIVHGGTGATTEYNARNNIGAAAALYINGSTWPDLWNVLSTIRATRSATAYVLGAAASLITGGAVSSACDGIIARYTAGTGFNFLLVQQSTGKIYNCVVTFNSTHDSATVGAVHTYVPSS